MYFTAQSKKSAGVLVFSQIILVFALLIVLVGQVSALPAPAALPNPEALPVPKRFLADTDAGGFGQWEWRLQEKEC